MSAQNTFDYQPDESEKKAEKPIKPAGAHKPAAAESVKKQEIIHPETALAVIEIKRENALAVFTAEKGLDPFLAELETRARAAIDGYDITTIAGQDGIRSVAYSLSKSKKPLENLAADLKKDADALIDKVNAERNRGIKFIDDLQKEVRRPLTEYEEKEKVRINGHKQNLDALSVMVVFEGVPTAELVQGRINSLTANFKDLNWQEFTESAKAATEKVTATLADLLAKIVKADADAAELARFRAAEEQRMQKERDEKIAAEAAEAARKEAERLAAITARNLAEVAEKAAAAAQKVINDQAAALAKAEQAKKDAAAKVIADKATADKALADAKYASELAATTALKKAESDKAAALKKQKDDAAAAQKVIDDAAIKQAAADKLRSDNAAHQAKIMRESLVGLKAISPGLPEDYLKQVIIAIAAGKIPHITIKY